MFGLGVGLVFAAVALAARRGRPDEGVLGTLLVVGASVAFPFGGRGPEERGADGVEGAGIVAAGCIDEVDCVAFSRRPTGTLGVLQDILKWHTFVGR